MEKQMTTHDRHREKSLNVTSVSSKEDLKDGLILDLNAGERPLPLDRLNFRMKHRAS